MLRNFEKHILLRILDDKWKEHLATMDHLRQGIHLRGYAQKNPKQEYKREAFELFQQMLEDIKHDTIRIISNVQVQEDDRTVEQERLRRDEMARRMHFEHAEAGQGEAEPWPPAPEIGKLFQSEAFAWERQWREFATTGDVTWW